LEVLFAIVVTTVGLLGAIAIFPVASSRARQARINDAAAVAGRSAVHAFDTRGMRRPDRWMGNASLWHTPAPAPTPPPTPTLPFDSINKIHFLPGTAFCIDPRFIAANLANPINARNASLFPSNPVPVLRDPRMFRITLNRGVSGSSIMDRLLADQIFVFDDDLAFIRPGIDDVSRNPLYATFSNPNDRSLPAWQPFEPFGSTPSLRRLTEGRFSWIATLVPKVDFASIAANPSARGLESSGTDEYTLSIVLFYNRPSILDMTNPLYDPLHERVVDTYFLGDGSTGGEVILHDTTATSVDEAAQRLKLRPNHWLLMAGVETVPELPPEVNSVPRFQWYRVIEVDSELEYGTSFFPSPGYQLRATLFGPDWAVDKYHNPTLPEPYNKTNNHSRAILLEGVVAVYETTIRLEYGSD
jgi:hypothetical protein